MSADDELTSDAAAALRRHDDSSPSDAMWAAVEEPAALPSQHGAWGDLSAIMQDLPARPSDGANAQSVDNDGGRGDDAGGRGSRESHYTEVSTPRLDGGGLRLDMKAWEKGMGEVISSIGLKPPDPPPAPLAERMLDSENRLRILEEDRDVLREQAAKLQSMLDSEREDRQLAQNARKEAVDKLRELDSREAALNQQDVHRITELQDTVTTLQRKLERARKSMNVPAPDVLESLRKRTQYLEDMQARKESQQLQWQREMGKKLAITLKVLQLQKEHAAKVEETQDKLHRYVSEAAAEASHARDRVNQRSDKVATLGRRLDVIYSEETQRQREVGQVRQQLEALLSAKRQRAGALAEYEGGLAEDLKTMEYERRLHVQLMAEHSMESSEGGGAEQSVAGAIHSHWENLCR